MNLSSGIMKETDESLELFDEWECEQRTYNIEEDACMCELDLFYIRHRSGSGFKMGNEGIK